MKHLVDALHTAEVSRSEDDDVGVPTAMSPPARDGLCCFGVVGGRLDLEHLGVLGWPLERFEGLPAWALTLRYKRNYQSKTG